MVTSAQRGARGAEAERGYREALALDPDRVPAYVNLADLFRQTELDVKGETALRQSLTRQPGAVALHSAGHKREARTVGGAGTGYPSFKALRSRLAEEVRKR